MTIAETCLSGGMQERREERRQLALNQYDCGDVHGKHIGFAIVGAAAQGSQTANFFLRKGRAIGENGFEVKRKERRRSPI